MSTPTPLWKLARDGDMEDLARRTDTAEGREEINTSMDEVSKRQGSSTFTFIYYSRLLC